VPGVQGAAFTSLLPLNGNRDSYGVAFQALPAAIPADTPSALRYVVTPGYLAAMHIPLLRGRVFDEHDKPGTPPVVLINTSFARRWFPGMNPIGQHLKAGPDLLDQQRPWATVIGVVADVKQDSLSVGDANEFYMPIGQWPWVDNQQTLVVRASGDPLGLVPALQRAVWSVDSDQPITRVLTMRSVVAASAADRRFALTLFGAFSAVALILAALGIYGVLAGSVSERAREIGVRSALGASRGAIVGLVGGDGMRLAGTGVIIGVAGAIAASQGIASLLYGVTPLDPMTYAAMVAVLAIVSVLACWLPAWRATRVDPAITLRLE
jgi:putative ABC transport system permease protein